MQTRVTAAVPVCYVRSLEAARDFYTLFGYDEVRAGGDGDGRWSYLQCGDHTLLLVCVQPPLIPVELPLLIYLYVEDLDGVTARFDAAGVGYEPVGYPEHALGGEVRTRDPDGNVVLFGQRAAAVPRQRTEPTEAAARFSLIQQAAEHISRRGGAPESCQIGLPDGGPCPQPAELKLADPWGETVWGCMRHADEALLNARSAFIATDDEHGLGPWLRQRLHR